MKPAFVIAVTTLAFLCCFSTGYGRKNTDSMYGDTYAAMRRLNKECETLKAKIAWQEKSDKTNLSLRQIQRYLREANEGIKNPEWVMKIDECKPFLAVEKPDTKFMSKFDLELARMYYTAKSLHYRLRSIVIHKHGKICVTYMKAANLAEKHSKRYEGLVNVYEEALKEYSYKRGRPENLGLWKPSLFPIRYTMQEKMVIANAMRKLRNQRIRLQKEIEEDQPKTSEIVAAYKKEMQDNELQHWSSLPTEIEYDIEKLLNNFNKAIEYEGILELAVELNHLKSVWYELRSTVLTKEGDRLDPEYEKAAQKASELSKKHKSIYKVYEMDLKAYLLDEHGFITEVDSGVTHTTAEGHRIQSKVDMVEATRKLQFSISILADKIRIQLAKNNLMKQDAGKAYLLASLQRCFSVPAKKVLYTAHELCRFPNKFPSNEFLGFAMAYHKHESLWYKFRGLLLDEASQNSQEYKDVDIQSFKKVAANVNEHAVYHESLIELFAKYYPERPQNENSIKQVGNTAIAMQLNSANAERACETTHQYLSDGCDDVSRFNLEVSEGPNVPEIGISASSTSHAEDTCESEQDFFIHDLLHYEAANHDDLPEIAWIDDFDSLNDVMNIQSEGTDTLALDHNFGVVSDSVDESIMERDQKRLKTLHF